MLRAFYSDERRYILNFLVTQEDTDNISSVN